MGKTTLCNTIVGLKRARSRLDPLRRPRDLDARAARDRPASASATCRRAGASGEPHRRRASAARGRARGAMPPGRSSASTRRFRGWPSGAAMAARSSPAASSRCWRSRGRCSAIPSCWSWTSRPRAWRRSSSSRSSAMLVTLAEEGEMAVLVIEQNIGVATAVAEPCRDHGQRPHQPHHGRARAGRRPRTAAAAARRRPPWRRGGGAGGGRGRQCRAARRRGLPHRARRRRGVRRCAGGGVYRPVTDCRTAGTCRSPPCAQAAVERDRRRPTRREKVFAIPFAERIGRTVLVVGTFDTKGNELRFIADRLRRSASGPHRRSLDLRQAVERRRDAACRWRACIRAAARRRSSPATAASRCSAMAEAFARWIERERDIGGIISAGGSGGTSLATAGMRVLPVGIPKIMVSTVASGDVGRYVGAGRHHDAAFGRRRAGPELDHRAGPGQCRACAGRHGRAHCRRAEAREADASCARPALGITMFGVTTPAVQAITRRLEARLRLPGLPRHRHRRAVDGEPRRFRPARRRFIDLTTTEVADMLVGGVFPATEDRFGAASAPDCPMSARSVRSTWSISARATRCRRNSAAAISCIHNPNVTLMRTTRDENRAFGEWIGERLNRMNGPVRFLLPEGGVSMLDAPGKPFHDPEADNALFEAIEKTVAADAAAPGRARAAPTSTTTPFVDGGGRRVPQRSRPSCKRA